MINELENTGGMSAKVKYIHAGATREGNAEGTKSVLSPSACNRTNAPSSKR